MTSMRQSGGLDAKAPAAAAHTTEISFSGASLATLEGPRSDTSSSGSTQIASARAPYSPVS